MYPYKVFINLAEFSIGAERESIDEENQLTFIKYLHIIL